MSSDKPPSSVAAAFELAAVLCGVVGVFLLFSMTLFGLSMLGAGVLLILIAWVSRRHDEQTQRSAKLQGGALVDRWAMRELRAANIPPHIIRAVDRVGSNESLEAFRDRLTTECVTGIPAEQLDLILRAVRVPVSAFSKAGAAVVTSDDAASVAPPMNVAQTQDQAAAS